MDNNDTAGRKLAFTVYDCATHTQGRTGTTTYEALCASLMKRDVRPGKDGRSFSPYRLTPGSSRANTNVEFMSMAVADIDDGVTLDALREFIEPFTWVATSSHSHTAEHAKFRLVFPLTRDVMPHEWKQFRTGFEALLQGHCDPSTKDLARFYYRPSCPAEHADAAFYESHEGTWLDPDNFGLSAAASPETVLPVAGAPRRFEVESDAAIGKAAHPPSDPEKVATHCAQVRDFMATGGATEPTWWANLGMLKHCANGEEHAHRGSSHYGDYDFAHTQTKMDTWSYGPTTCAKFKECNPGPCDGCAYDGKVKSPIQLGYSIDVATPTLEIVDDTSGEVIAEPIPNWPGGGYRVNNNTLECMIADEEGVARPSRFAAPLFYPVDRVQLDDGTYGLTVRMNVRGDRWREFEIPTKALAEIRSLKVALASYEIVVYDDKMVRAYMNDYLTALRIRKEEVNSFKRFGWHNDGTGVLIGTTYFTEDNKTEVRVSDAIVKDEQLLRLYQPKGTKEEWTEGVDKLYNQKHGEPYQYAICSQLGSLLVPLLGYENWHGIPYAMTSEASGLSKTTSALIGGNALFCAPRAMLAQVTPKAIIVRASMMQNLPLVVDEVTDSLKDPIDLSDTMYALSNGRPRIALTSDGRERVPVPPFNLGSTLTANKNLMFKLTESKVNPEATQMRIFEVSLDDYPKMKTLRPDSKDHAEHHELSVHLMSNVHGVWTEDYLNFLFKNRKLIEEKLHSTAIGIVTALGGNASKERFYAYHMACTLVACWIARKLGMVRFDVTNLKHWSFKHILRMRETAQEFSLSIEDRFSELLSSLHGRVLVTKHYEVLDTKSGKIEVPMLQTRGDIVARLVLGSDLERGKLFVSVRAIDEWCHKNTVSPSEFKRSLNEANLLRKGGDQGKGFDRKASLGRGVPSHPMGQCRVLEFEFSAAQGYMNEFVAKANVVPIGAGAATAPAVANESVEAGEAAVSP